MQRTMFAFIFAGAVIALLLSVGSVAQISQVNQTILGQAAPGQGLQLNFNISGHPIHIFPRADKITELAAQNNGTVAHS